MMVTWVVFIFIGLAWGLGGLSGACIHRIHSDFERLKGTVLERLRRPREMSGCGLTTPEYKHAPYINNAWYSLDCL